MRKPNSTPKKCQKYESLHRETCKTSEHPHLWSLICVMWQPTDCYHPTHHFLFCFWTLFSAWQLLVFTPDRSGLWRQHLLSRNTFKHMTRARLSKQSLQRRFNRRALTHSQPSVPAQTPKPAPTQCSSHFRSKADIQVRSTETLHVVLYILFPRGHDPTVVGLCELTWGMKLAEFGVDSVWRSR